MGRAQASCLLFSRMGKPVRWFRRIGKCPCMEHGRPDPAHDLCQGAGELYEEVDVSAYKALVSRVSQRLVMASNGTILQGDLSFSALPDQIPVGEGDLIVPLGWELRHTETLVRGAGPFELLTHLEPTGLDALYTASGALDPATLSLNGRRLVWGEWAPTEGTRFTVLYRFRPRFAVRQGSLSVRGLDEDGQPLPTSCNLRLWVPGAFDGEGR